MIRLVNEEVRQPAADAHGLEIINERRISTCWSTDRHLEITGAKLVIQGV